MTTMTSPQPTSPRHVDALADASFPIGHSPLKRTQTSRHWSGQVKPIASPRVRYLAASGNRHSDSPGFIKPHQQLGISQAPLRGSNLRTTMSRSIQYEARSSAIQSTTSLVVSDDLEVPFTGLDRISAKDQSDLVTAIVTPSKTLYEKALPPRPALRSEYSPERRSVYDASDIASTSLDSRYPPLEPTSSPKLISSVEHSAASDNLSVASDSFSITESLRTNGRSPFSNSPETVEYGIATTTTIQSYGKPLLVPIMRHHGHAEYTDTQEQSNKARPSRTSPIRYVLATPRPIQQQQLNFTGHVSHPKNGSPTRALRHKVTSSKVANRSSLRGGDAVSRRGRIAVAAVRRKALEASKENDNNDSILSHTASDDHLLQEESPLGDLGIDVSTCCSQRSSKYGYNIRESFDAHEFIMGEQGKAAVKTCPYEGSDFRSANGPGEYGVREVKIQLNTPFAKDRAKNMTGITNEDHAQLSTFQTNGNKALRSAHLVKKDCYVDEEVPKHVANIISSPVTVHQQLGVTPSHPPRISSLSGPPASAAFDESMNSRMVQASHNPAVPSAIKTEVCAPDHSAINLSGGEVPRPSLFYQQTASSAARASLAGKKSFKSQVSGSSLPPSRTMSSLSDVSKGMKKLGQKVGKIIPGRRSTTDMTTSKDLYPLQIEEVRMLSRQPSQLLTTYKNSGMKNATRNGTLVPVRNVLQTCCPQPHDKQESTESCTGKNVWSHASEGQTVDADRGYNVLPLNVPRDSPADGGNGDEPPNHRSTRGIQTGHYVEAIEEEPTNSGRDEIPTDSTGDGSHRATPINSSRSNTRPENGVPQASIPNNIFDRMIVETDDQARGLMEYAIALEESHFRDLMIESATRLAEGLMRLREARIQSIRMSQAIDEMTVIMANSNLRMNALLRDST